MPIFKISDGFHMIPESMFVYDFSYIMVSYAASHIISLIDN
jgi:hypothetical protein